jgi:hypothetical protein
MGRVSRLAAVLLAGVLAAAFLAGCENALQSFIFDTLFGPPYRREMARLVPDPNLGSYGFAVDISGDYMIVGEPNRDGGKGGARVYHRTSGETWDSGILLPAPSGALGPDTTNGMGGDNYGYAVATSGDYAVLGAMNAGDRATGKKQGRVAIYARNTTSGAWYFVSDFGLADIPGATPAPLDYDLFGNVVSIDGTWMAIGARQDQNGVPNDSCGAVYLFQNVGGTWTFKEKKRAKVPQDGAAFGFSVDLAGDLLIVGSHYEDIEGAPIVAPYRQGAAYIFTFDTDNWQFSDRITAPDAEHMALFGVSVGISGSYAVVGSPLKTVNGVTQAGAAYMFQRAAADDWHSIPAAVVTLKDPGLEDWYGWAAAIRGDHALVSAFNRDERGTNAGAAYVYSRTTGNTWVIAGTVSPSDAMDNLYFGMSLALDADHAVVGATAPPPAAAKGAAYIFK